MKLAYELTPTLLIKELEKFRDSEEYKSLDLKPDQRRAFGFFLERSIQFLTGCKDIRDLYLKDFHKNSLETKLKLLDLFKRYQTTFFVNMIESILEYQGIRNRFLHIACDLLEQLGYFTSKLPKLLAEGIIKHEDIERYLGSGSYGAVINPKLTQQPTGYVKKIVPHISYPEFYFLKWLSQQDYSWFRDKPFPRIYDVSTDGKSASYLMDEVLSMKEYYKVLEKGEPRWLLSVNRAGEPKLREVKSDLTYLSLRTFTIDLPVDAKIKISDVYPNNYGVELRSGTKQDPDKWIVFDLGIISIYKDGKYLRDSAPLAKIFGLPEVAQTKTSRVRENKMKLSTKLQKLAQILLAYGGHKDFKEIREFNIALRNLLDRYMISFASLQELKKSVVGLINEIGKEIIDPFRLDIGKEGDRRNYYLLNELGNILFPKLKEILNEANLSIEEARFGSLEELLDFTLGGASIFVKSLFKPEQLKIKAEIPVLWGPAKREVSPRQRFEELFG